MSIGGYKIRNKEGIHFMTFAVVEWVDVFTRSQYADIVVDSLRYCQREKGLELYAWCVMSNHVHLIASSASGGLSDILRDFKKHTSKSIIQAIKENPGESRRDWMLKIFEQAGEANSRNQTFQFWRQDNQPKELFSNSFTDEKLKYLHFNPVEAGMVDEPEDYRYSSARDYAGSKGLLDILYLE